MTHWTVKWDSLVNSRKKPENIIKAFNRYRKDEDARVLREWDRVLAQYQRKTKVK